MAFSINRVTLLGRVATDPMLRFTSGGQAVLSLRLATSHSYQKDGEWVQVPQFTTCVFWTRQAEIVSQHVSKGEFLYVEGRLQSRSWDGPDGNKRYATEVVVRDFVIPKGKDQFTAAEGSSGGDATAEADESNEDSNSEDSSPPSAEGKSSGGEDVSAKDIPF